MDELNKSIQQVNDLATQVGKQRGTTLQSLDTIDAGSLGKTSAFNTPEPATPTKSPKLAASALSVAQQYRADQDAKMKADERQVKQDERGIKSIFSRLTGIESEKQQALQDAGVNDLKKELDAIASEMEAKDLATRRAVEDIQTKNAQGLFGAGATGEIQRLERENAREQADLAIVLAAKNRQYDTAYNIINDKANAETESLKIQLDASKFFYSEHKDELSKKEQRQYEQIIQEDERAYQEAQDLVKFKGDLQLKLIEAGAPTSIASQVSNAKDRNEALTLAAPYLATGGAEVPTIKTINGVDYQWNAATGQWEIPQISGTDNSQTAKVQEQVSFLLSTAQNAKELSGAAGTSGLRKTVGDFLVGDTKFRQLEAYANTLATNALTLASDPSIRKFFGPQMTEKDVELMTSAGTSLNVAKNSPAQFRAEVERLEKVFQKLNGVVQNAQTSGDLQSIADQQGFDLQGALNAGYTEDEVRAFLNQ